MMMMMMIDAKMSEKKERCVVPTVVGDGVRTQVTCMSQFQSRTKLNSLKIRAYLFSSYYRVSFRTPQLVS